MYELIRMLSTNLQMNKCRDFIKLDPINNSMFSCGNCFQRYVCKMVVKKQTRKEIIKEGLKEWSYETALHGLKYMKPGRTGILGIMIWVKKN